MSHEIRALCAGKSAAFRGEEESAIAKQALSGPVQITALGLAGDMQADLVHHGGPDMAVHLYPFDHHAWWRGELGDHELLGQPGAFGSNLSVAGLLEEDVWLGDRHRIGSVLLEVCQPRKPCWKIEHRFGARLMVKRILKSGRCGWYYRVIEEGTVQAGDMLTVEQRGQEGWSMARIFAAVWGTADKRDPELVRQIAQLPLLAERMRAKLLSGS